jgi:23S rRNA pseudouridine1911/1915/1917 synthase
MTFATVTLQTGGRLDATLAAEHPQYTRERIKQALREHGVRVNGVPARPSSPVQPGDQVEWTPPQSREAHALEPADIALDVRYEDEDLLVVDKPRGLVTHPAPGTPGPTLVHALLARGQELSSGAASFRPGIVHRLDKETTGLLMVAKNDAAHLALARQVASRKAVRLYLALVEGRFEAESLRIEARLGRDPRRPTLIGIRTDGKEAVTIVKRLGIDERGSLLRCRLETGRTHQIRVHLRATGHPVRGDTAYGARSAESLQLHAGYLHFAHPRDGRSIEVMCPPPADFVWSPPDDWFRD